MLKPTSSIDLGHLALIDNAERLELVVMDENILVVSWVFLLRGIYAPQKLVDLFSVYI